MRPRVLGALVVVACGARTGLDVSSVGAPDAHDEANVDASLDASDAHDAVADAPTACDYGTLVADVFGATKTWNGGASLPAGHYRVTYVDGCMKYSPGQGWTVNAYASGPDALWVASDTFKVGEAPGTVGFQAGQGAFANFDDCVKANQSIAPFEFDFGGGGTLGLWLADNPYTDNVAGENGRNPTYRLSSCP